VTVSYFKSSLLLVSLLDAKPMIGVAKVKLTKDFSF
jgi:hypothetical protein